MKSTELFKSKKAKFLLLGILALLATTWVLLTPAGLDGKIRAIGFAVCHQIESHSLEIGGKVLPLCSRCTGMFLGTLMAMMVLSNREKRSEGPSRTKTAILGVFFLLFVFDGVNSTLSFFSSSHPIYPPSNLLRLITGLMMGTILANLLLPLWNQTLWADPKKEKVLATWKQFILLFLAETVAGVLVIMNIPFLFYPIAILSIGMILLILNMVYSMLWMILLNRENSLQHFKEGFPYYLLGWITVFLQIGLMDFLRFRLVGSWLGFQI
ncbi:MAG: DUF2085 domain-containing protein [Chloroflexi bacterium]|nr:DUF2085 domain-containing protein [Chloroflexota bacterium]